MNYAWANPQTGLREQTGVAKDPKDQTELARLRAEAKARVWEELQSDSVPTPYDWYVWEQVPMGTVTASGDEIDSSKIDNSYNMFAWCDPLNGKRALSEQWPSHLKEILKADKSGFASEVVVYATREAFTVSRDEPKPEMPAPPPTVNRTSPHPLPAEFADLEALAEEVSRFIDLDSGHPGPKVTALALLDIAASLREIVARPTPRTGRRTFWDWLSAIWHDWRWPIRIESANGWKVYAKSTEDAAEAVRVLAKYSAGEQSEEEEEPDSPEFAARRRKQSRWTRFWTVVFAFFSAPEGEAIKVPVHFEEEPDSPEFAAAMKEAGKSFEYCTCTGDGIRESGELCSCPEGAAKKRKQAVETRAAQAVPQTPATPPDPSQELPQNLIGEIRGSEAWKTTPHVCQFGTGSEHGSAAATCFNCGLPEDHAIHGYTIPQTPAAPPAPQARPPLGPHVFMFWGGANCEICGKPELDEIHQPDRIMHPLAHTFDGLPGRSCFRCGLSKKNAIHGYTGD